ncbi:MULTISPECIES: thioredoxin family protein [unclassified Clostridium]|uniref:thioredoxin family protein n=1 Tax=unclassified Clostridium TaxID=2614128 RepID=UPI000298345C|nr:MULTISPECIES: thioredoxin family protein [unclassified Clostridium]EKQ56827.1 MAG: thioredoxin domain-containing protein [Clostridium sp. Maddingley MBC34-26]
MSLQHINSNQFDEIIYDNAEPSLVIFSRESCTICQGVVPILEDLKLKYDEKYSFYYVDVEEQKNLFQRFSLKGVPQILFFKEGEYKGKLTGHVEDDQIEEKISEIFEE